MRPTPAAIRENLAAVEERIRRACERTDRDPASVTLVAVSKTFPADITLAALEAGADFVGENRAQDLRDKARALGTAAAGRWHFVGHLQTNKVRLVVGTAALVHSVDRLGLAEAIAHRAEALGTVQDVLIEVNISEEPSKSGVDPLRALSLAEQVEGLRGLRVLGLMSMPPFPDSPEESRGHFRALREMGAVLSSRIEGATELSMGMTRDFEVAVEEGATIVRVGEAIFGPRDSR